MRVQVSHLSRYDYSSEVTLGMHQLFLQPQFRPYFRVLEESFTIHPSPDGQNYRQDALGTWYKQAWFSEPTNHLKITTEWLFELIPHNPFAFIIDKGFEDKAWNHPQFLFHYEGHELFVQAYKSNYSNDSFLNYLMPIKEKSTGLIDFLVNLTQEIYQNWSHEIRHEQNIWQAGFTFSQGKGSCRDLSLMQMELLRILGLACRFVSGYAFNPDLEDGHELHAWMEVFLPGAGWIGLDPSLGLLTDHRYIPLACHADPERTLPVQGTFGGVSDSALETHVDMKLI
ncbi:Transglutaminase-like enzyme, putative cysteine protease [Algoriphagus faecimaris]|uniref:Transglutaminase-like enzyme, putative cysteine protease n=1 Tax=Algoriphagus faecimaris TaxID=686796 RepID=A0A1G6NJY1_9BACT|nr:transglutaminase family protein [Algoriphagus faecimaris]SDC67674.1 Transglutaminase-like enzyme, putative cysteine protease [Algoriphagus faecimaris]